MIRRRLFAYTVMYALGIVAGYIMCEKTNVIMATLFLILVGYIVNLLDLETQDDKRYKRILFTIMLIGTSIFFISYINTQINLDTSNINSVEGRIIRVQSRQDGIQFIIQTDDSQYGNKILVNYYGDSRIEEYDKYIGSKFRFCGKMKTPSESMNPTCFNYSLYLKSLSIKYIFSAKTLNECEDGELSPINRYRREIMRRRIAFEKYFKGEIAAIIKGMIFGDKNEIDDETREEFNENGTGHILAVSGLHVGFLFSLLRIVTKKRRTIIVYIGIVIIVMMYGEMTQWSPSTIRAVLVLSISLFSMHLRRPFDLLSSVSLAALVLMIWNPYMLFNSGFQMSFLAMLGIAFLTKPLSFFIGDYMAMLIAVQLSMMPYTAYTFNRINPLSLIINIPIIAIAGILVPVCIIGIGLISIIGSMPEVLVQFIKAGCKLLLVLNKCLNMDGFLSFKVISINTGLLIFLYLTMFMLASEWTRIRLIRNNYVMIKQVEKYIICFSVVCAIAFFNPFIDDEIVFVNVGQGDCTHIRTMYSNIIIDGGGQSDLLSTYSVGEKILEPYLLKNGCNRLNAAYVTHLHSDHYNGVKELNEIFPIDYIGISRQYFGAELPINTKYFEANAVIKMSGNCMIKAIWPLGEEANKKISSNEKNENNTVYLVKYKGIKVLITGDLLEEDELKMINYYKNTNVLDCDILKVAHHGSKSSTSEELLDAVSPSIAVISVGENNMYGHPHKQTLDRLSARGIKIYRTDINGAVGIDIANNRIKSVDTVRH